MILPFVWRDIREQYAGSWGGVIWSVCQPLFLIFLYWWVFSKILRVRIPMAEGAGSLPFIVFLLSALLPWFAFQDGLIKGTSAIIGHRDVVKKVHFPVIIFPVAAVIAACINHGIGYAIFLVGFFVWQNHISFEQLTAIVAILMVQIFFTAGLAVLLSAIAVYLRDVIQIIGLVLPAFFYTSPILYPYHWYRKTGSLGCH
ncbi:MAG: ABC transporter permease [Candidatus Competibacteraceae bacterium]|nr:ABC transporter permease [Candidatus Competibacteraceae bacterium]